MITSLKVAWAPLATSVSWMGKVNSTAIIEGLLSDPWMTKAIMMGLWVGPTITHTSQSNRGTRGHHLPYPSARM